MTARRFEIPEQVQSRALAEGPAGEAWLAGLGSVVEELAARWGLVVGRTLAGGTEAFVADDCPSTPSWSFSARRWPRPGCQRLKERVS